MTTHRDELYQDNKLFRLYDALFHDAKIGTISPGKTPVGTASVVIRPADSKRTYLALFHDGENTALFLGVGASRRTG